MDVSKLILGVSVTVFGGIGSYLPVLFGDQDPFSAWSFLLGTIGSILGIWVWYKLKDSIG
jgi:hypothetical protein